MESTYTRQGKAPQREDGRKRVADLLAAAAETIREKGYDAATMSEIAGRADARIGSLYRFFPSKEAVGDALIARYAEVLGAEYARVKAFAGNATFEQLADVLIDLLWRLYPQTSALTALLDSRSDWNGIRTRFRNYATTELSAILKISAPALGAEEASGIAATILGNMKSYVSILSMGQSAPFNSADELRLMNRLYLAARLPA